MSEGTDNLVLELLRQMRTDISVIQDEMSMMRSEMRVMRQQMAAMVGTQTIHEEELATLKL